MPEPTSIQAATETREKVGSSLPARTDTARYVSAKIDLQTPRLKAVAPSGFDAKRFSHLVVTAVKATPRLIRCFESPQGELSVMLAAMQAAELGLEPNTRLEHCWLLPRRNGQVEECQLSIGYRGYLELAGRSDKVKTLYAEVVCEHDEFHWARGLADDELRHVQAPSGERGEFTHAYAVVRLMNGGHNFIVLDRAEVEDRRAKSDSWKSEKSRPYSPWTTNTKAMWRKSAVRALVPWLPMAAAAQKALALDETSFRLADDGGEIIPAEYTVADLDAIEAGVLPDDAA